MSNVVDLDVITKLPIPADKVLSSALYKLEDVIVIGTTVKGEEWFASSSPSGSDVLWDLERAKYKLLKIVDEMNV